MVGCFAFLVAFAMARHEIATRPAPPPASAAEPAATEPVLAELDDGPAPAGPYTQFVN